MWIPKDFEILDRYEGLPILYSRRETQVFYAHGQPDLAQIYIPTQQTIIKYNLQPTLDPTDSWRTFIAKFPEISIKYPELFWDSNQLKDFLR